MSQYISFVVLFYYMHKWQTKEVSQNQRWLKGDLIDQPTQKKLQNIQLDKRQKEANRSEVETS